MKILFERRQQGIVPYFTLYSIRKSRVLIGRVVQFSFSWPRPLGRNTAWGAWQGWDDGREILRRVAGVWLGK